MPNVQFQGFSDSLSHLPGVIRSIPDILRDPAANPLQASILLGIALVLALILVLSLFLILMRPGAEESALLAEDEFPVGPPPLPAAEQAELERKTRAQRRWSGLTLASVIVIVFAVAWVAAGVTTSQPQLCVSCHQTTSHTAAEAHDPHARVACVDCHEGGGTLARISVNVITRVEHVALAQLNPNAAKAFGKPVASDACLSCHGDQIKGTYYDPLLKVKVAHANPIAAGAECIDCHTLNSGVVNSATVGMDPCLRCHDGKQAKAECSTCHVGDPSQAIRPKIALGEMAAAQVPNPQCTGCHKDMTKCNACHGIAMPHSAQFEAYGHALPASLDIWNNHLGVCRKCHYPGHNNCIQAGCHGMTFPAHPSPAWESLHGVTSWSQSNVTCSCHKWNPYDHDGMNFCQICHPAKPKNARP